ncbi:unnamed protein product, partial [Staurois parvus]
WAPVLPPHAAARPSNLPWAPVPPPHLLLPGHVICHGPLYSLLMLLPGPESLWVPVRPPIAAVSIATLLPCATFRSPHTAGVFHFVIGCWQITVLHCYAARPVICHRPLYRLLMLLPVQSLSWVPVRPPIAAVSIATLCHVSLSGLLTLLVGSILS